MVQKLESNPENIVVHRKAYQIMLDKSHEHASLWSGANVGYAWPRRPAQLIIVSTTRGSTLRVKLHRVAFLQ